MMNDPRYALGPGPGWKPRPTPPPPPAKEPARRRYAAQARAFLAAAGFAPAPDCAREGCGHSRGAAHRKRLDGTWGACNRCPCEWYEAPRREDAR